MKKIAAYCGNRKVYDDFIPSIKSILINSDVDEVYLLIEDDEFPHPLPECVKIINVNRHRYISQYSPNRYSVFSYIPMYRAALCYLLPSVERILALDCDVFAVKDISDLWELPIDDCYFAASREFPKSEKLNILYTNIGVCLYNLKKLRDGKADEALYELNNNRYQFLEQDVFNKICQGAIYDMPGDYNANEYVEHSDDPKIIHYAGVRKWRDKDLVKKFEDIPWSDIRGGLCAI